MAATTFVSAWLRFSPSGSHNGLDISARTNADHRFGRKFAEHRDRPGLIGAVGKITGDADINISSMHLGRLAPRGQALMVLALDEPLPEAQQKQILGLTDVQSVKLVKL